MSLDSTAASVSEPAAALDRAAASAFDVLERTLGWLLRAPGALTKARYVEPTLARWADSAVAHPVHGQAFANIRAALEGVDALEDDARQARVAEILALVSGLRSGIVATPPLLPQARLLPDGVADERRQLAPPPPPQQVAPVITVDIREEVRALREESAREEGEELRGAEGRPSESRQDRPRNEGSKNDGRRNDGPRNDGNRNDGNRNDSEGSRNDRRDRNGRRDERPDRNGRPDTRGREGDREPRREDPPREEPKEPEIRYWALGHPEHTGAPLSGLNVYTEAELAALTAADIEDIAALLQRAPVATERAGDRLVTGVPPTGPVIVRGQVTGRCTRFAAGTRRYEVKLKSERGATLCRWSNPSPEIATAPVGFELGLAGRWEASEDAVEGGPEGVLLDAEVLGIDGRGGDWLPRYDVPGVDDSRVRSGLRVALKRFADNLTDHLPPEVLERHKLISLAAALRDVHFPSNMSRKGRARLAFDELLQVQLGVALMRQRQGRERGTSNPVLTNLIARALAMSGWQFTDAQESAFDEIRRDLRRSQPMARLLQADAGAGAHDLLAAVMITVAESKHQVLVLCPDAMTAEHQFLFAEGLLRNAGLEPVLLTGPVRGAQAEAIKKGETLVVFGTHSHANEPPTFRKLGLVILEERENFGRVDTSKLEEAGRPDMLFVTPSPVPASVALSVYGHLALTTLAAPAPHVDTAVYAGDDRADAYAIAREAIEQKQQVLLAFPLLRGTDLLASSEARRMAETLQETAFPGARISIFHGALSKEERFRAFDDFLHRRADVLLATTHVENGPVIPNATVLIVEQAQEFDIVRLHQLRALVGQGARPGRCLLILGHEPDAAVASEARARIDAFCKETDGWQVAELQAGWATAEDGEDAQGFVWAEPARDRELLIKTRQDAVRLLALDPGLKRRSHRALLAQVRSRLGEDVSLDGEEKATTLTAAGTANAAAQNARRKRRRRR